MCNLTLPCLAMLINYSEIQERFHRRKPTTLKGEYAKKLYTYTTKSLYDSEQRIIERSIFSTLRHNNVVLLK